MNESDKNQEAQTSNECELISGKELAEIVGVIPNTINVWRKQGKLTAAFIYKHTIRYNKAEALAALFGPDRCSPEFHDKRKA